MNQDLPFVINASPATEIQNSPLGGIARVIQPNSGELTLTEAEVLSLAKQNQPVGIIVPGEIEISVELLDAIPSLRIVSNTAVGYNNLPLEEMAKRGIWATNTPESFVHGTADLTFTFLLSVVRKLIPADRFVRSGKWPSMRFSSRWDGVELRGKTMGIVGYGRIGEEVAKRAEAFGMEVVLYRRTQVDDPRWRSLDELLAESDVVSVHAPLTSETKHLIDATAFRRMKPGAILLNLARGPVVDERALCDALKSGHLGGAGLDVFEAEPVVQPELFEMENVVLTPHIGGATLEGRMSAQIVAAQNVAKVIQGEAPLTPVNRPESESLRK